MPASAANIPPELFQYILKVLTLSENIQAWTTDFVRIEKKELARCALVCRYWADICQTQLFRDLALKSAEDFTQLCAFLKSPHSRVSQYIWDLSIDVELKPSSPWLHLVTLYEEEYRLNVEINAKLQGPLPARTIVRSVHHALPRLVPSTFSWNIRSLSLTTVHFSHFSHLLRLLAELDRTRSFDFSAVTWNEVADDTPFTQRIFAKSKLRKLTTIEMHECTADWTAIRLLIGLRPPEFGSQAQTESIALLTSMQELKGLLGSVWTDFKIEAVAHLDDIDYSMSCSGRMGEMSLTYSLSACVRRTASSDWRFLHIAVDIVGATEDASKSDWSSFDEHICDRKDVQKLIFGFESRERMCEFVKVVVEQQLLRTRESKTLVYAIRHDKHGHGAHNELWAYANPTSKDVKASPFYDLYLL